MLMNIRLVVLCALVALSATDVGQNAGDAMVEEEEDAETLTDETTTTATKGGGGYEDEDDTDQLRPSPNAVTSLLFVEPADSAELIGGKVSRILVGLENAGNEDFVVESVGASLRYPGDYNYVVHNYTAHKLAYLLRPNSEATFDYAFMPIEAFAGRPFVLVISLNYKQSTGKQYSSAVYNGTVFIHEDVSSGFVVETLFLHLIVVSFVLLLAVLLYRFLMSKKRQLGLSSKRAPIELGTSNMADVDLDWIPKSALLLNSNAAAAKTPKQRKVGRAKTAGEG